MNILYAKYFNEFLVSIFEIMNGQQIQLRLVADFREFTFKPKKSGDLVACITYIENKQFRIFRKTIKLAVRFSILDDRFLSRNL